MPIIARRRPGDQVVERSRAHDLEHRADLVVVRADVAADELVPAFELGE
jgi:hypothetical protein